MGTADVPSSLPLCAPTASPQVRDQTHGMPPPSAPLLTGSGSSWQSLKLEVEVELTLGPPSPYQNQAVTLQPLRGPAGLT